MTEVLSAARMAFADALAVLVAARDIDAPRHIATMLLTCQDLPEVMFVRPGDLAIKVAPLFERFPNAAALRTVLLGEAKHHVAELPLPYPHLACLTKMDRLWIKFWLEHAATQSKTERASLLDLIRVKSRAAYDIICAENLCGAAALAIEHR